MMPNNPLNQKRIKGYDVIRTLSNDHNIASYIVKKNGVLSIAKEFRRTFLNQELTKLLKIELGIQKKT